MGNVKILIVMRVISNIYFTLSFRIFFVHIHGLCEANIDDYLFIIFENAKCVICLLNLLSFFNCRLFHSLIAYLIFVYFGSATNAQKIDTSVNVNLALRMLIA